MSRTVQQLLSNALFDTVVMCKLICVECVKLKKFHCTLQHGQNKFIYTKFLNFKVKASLKTVLYTNF